MSKWLHTSKWWDIFLVVLIVTSLVLTTFESIEWFFTPAEQLFVDRTHIFILVVFFLEYVMRLYKAPDHYTELSASQARWKFVRQPLAIIDLIVILPLFLPLFWFFGMKFDLVVLRILRVLRLLNIFKLYRHSPFFDFIKRVFRETWQELAITVIWSIQVILIGAVLIYQFENQVNEDINTLFDGIWWSVVTLTTVWYGDVTPVTVTGKIISMMISVCGIFFVALPAWIFSAGFNNALNDKRIFKKAVSRK